MENTDFTNTELPTETSDLFAPMGETTELPEAEIQTDFANELVDDNGTVDQSLFEPLPSIDETQNNEVTETEVSESNEAEKTGTEEDVWKF